MSQLYINGGELKHCTFGCDFTQHAQEFGRKYKQTLCGENIERNRLCGWGSPTQCAGNRHTTYTPNVSSELILDLTAAGATDTEEKKLSYAKKYGVLSRPGYLSRCMHSNNSNNMCTPNSVFLSVEENQKRSVIEDK